MFKTSLRAKIKSKFEELKRRWKRSSTLGKIKMCLFNYFVFILLLSSIIVCISTPSLNNYSIPLFLLTGFYGAVYDPSEEPFIESEEPLIIVVVKNIVLFIACILGAIAFFMVI